MTESEQRFELLLVVPAVAHEDTLVVGNLVRTGVFAQCMGAVVLQPHGECKGQFARGIHSPEHHVGQRIAGLRTREPRLQNSRNAVDPRHRHGVARDHHHGQVGIGFGQRFDHPVLRIGQTVLQAVGALTVLMVALVESADEDHDIGLARRGNGIGDELGLGTFFREVLPGLHAVVVARHVADITAFVDHLGLVTHGGTDALQRRIFMPDFERRGTAAHGHHLHGVLPHDGNRLRFPQVDRQYPAVVFQQHHTLARNAARSGKMLGRIERSERLLRIHRRAENQAQHPARLVVERRRRCLAFAQHIEIGSGQIVIVIGVAGSPAQAVGPRTKLHVETVLCGLLRVVNAAPSGDDHPVERPVAFENVVQQVLVVAAMLALIFIIGAHDRPGPALADGSFEGRQVNFVQGPVVDLDVDAVAVHLLVVQRIVLHAGGHAVLLHPLNIGNHHPRGKEGVFAHILEITAVQRRAVDVHARAQQDVLLAVAGLLADGFAVEGRHLGIPRRGEARQGRESRAGIVRPAGLLPLVPQNLGTNAVRAVGAPHLGDAQTGNARRGEFRLRMQDGDLLFEGHPRKCVLDALFDRLRLVEVDRNVAPGLLPAAAGNCRKGAQPGEGLYQDIVWHWNKKICLVCTRSAQSEGCALRIQR